MLDDRRNVENHGRRGAVLPDLAVDLGHQRVIAGVGNLIPGHQKRADRAEGVEGLALAPQPAAVDLEGALGDIIDQREPGDVVPGRFARDVAPAGADDEAELDLVVELVRPPGN